MQLVKIYTYINQRSPRPLKGIGMYLLETKTQKGPYTKSDFTHLIAGANSLEVATLLDALTRLKTNCELIIHTGDYVPGLIKSGQIEKWEKAGWITKKGTDVKDRFLLISLIEELGKHKVTFVQEKHEYHSWMEMEVRKHEQAEQSL